MLKMEQHFAISAILIGTVVSALWFLADRFYVPRHTSVEPPLLPSKIPYIGHILGLLRHGSKYYQMTSNACKRPIYSLNMLNGKVYIVTSPDLVAAVNRNSKSLAFNPFIAQLGMRITGHDKPTSQIVQHNLNGEEGPGYVTEIHDGLIAALAPGVYLENMIEPMLREVTTYLKDLDLGAEVSLFSWVRQMVTMCSTRAIYGPSNPFSKNASYSNLFWDFDQDLNLLILDIFPKVVAPKGAYARSTLGDAFESYFKDYMPDETESSSMIKHRTITARQWGVSTWNQGRLEVGTLLGVLANTIPSSFYTLVHIYADPDLLHDIRTELETNAVTTAPGKHDRELHIMRVRNDCPLLYSTFQETLRMHAQGSSTRFVREDTWLDGRYLLKKNGIVQMPMAVMHSDPLIWGADVGSFNPRRFMKNETGRDKNMKGSATAYRPFGGGASMCPGRHFVTLEVMMLTALLVLRFDMSLASGSLEVPDQKQESLATNVFPPKEDVRVQVRRRKGWEKIEWAFQVQ